MKELIKIFNEIQTTRSIKEKKRIIAENADNELFKKCLKFLLDTDITTGISSKKIKKEVSPSSELAPYYICARSSFEDVMGYLAVHNTGTDADIYEIQCFLSGHEEDREFYEEMITKKFRLGCDKKVVNACIPGLIPSWDIQQAYPISEKNEPKDGDWFSLSQKINGNNCSFYKGQLISRQGKSFTGLGHIIEDIKQIPDYEKFFFNGELVRKNTDGLSDSDNFQLGTGIINSDDVDKSCIKFIIYEVLPIEEFEAGESKLTYKQRYESVLSPLEVLITERGLSNLEVIEVVYQGTDKAQIGAQLDLCEERDWEGLMLNKDTKWKNKRNNGILKVKAFKSADILCFDIAEGDGKYKGTLGKILCDFKGCTLGVGSGFTDEQRNYYWEHPNEIIGRVIQIKYKEETKNKQGGVSVSFPVFECVRERGKEVSYN